MVFLRNYVGADYTTEKKIIADLYADTKEEVTNNMEILGIKDTYLEDYELHADSKVHTAKGEIAILDSQGTWHWIGEDEEESTTDT